MVAKPWTSIETSGSVNLFSAVPDLTEGSESLLLAGDVVEEPPEYRGFHVWRLRRPGLGGALDEEKVVHYRRAS